MASVNQEVFGGLVSAMSRGETLHGAMISLFNAGYKKSDIEDAARVLQSQTPVQFAQKQVVMKKKQEMEKKSPPKKKVVIEKKKEIPVKKEKEEKMKQNVSKYEGTKKPGDFEKILDETIKSLQGSRSSVEVIEPGKGVSRPPIIIQKVSEYGGAPTRGKPASKSAIVVLIILLVLLLGALVGLFIFKEKIINLLNNLNF